MNIFSSFIIIWDLLSLFLFSLSFSFLVCSFDYRMFSLFFPLTSFLLIFLCNFALAVTDVFVFVCVTDFHVSPPSILIPFFASHNICVRFSCNCPHFFSVRLGNREFYYFASSSFPCSRHIFLFFLLRALHLGHSVDTTSKDE